jgi:hypothetical protein
LNLLIVHHPKFRERIIGIKKLLGY